MPELGSPPSLHRKIANRQGELFNELRQTNYIKTDRLFGGLLLFEWLAGIIVALVVSPRTWAGSHSDIHIHV